MLFYFLSPQSFNTVFFHIRNDFCVAVSCIKFIFLAIFFIICNKQKSAHFRVRILVRVFLQDLTKNAVKSRVSVPKAHSQKGDSDSEPSVPFLRIRKSSDMSELCFFTKKQSKRYKACSDVVRVFLQDLTKNAVKSRVSDSR